MAKRPVYYVPSGSRCVKEEAVEFVFCPGFSLEQKRRSIANLHESFGKNHPGAKVLEVSRRSVSEIGTRLSAFNLRYTMGNGERIPVESVFQSSKCFKNGDHYPELLHKPPGVAKNVISERFERLSEALKKEKDGAKRKELEDSLELKEFILDGNHYPLKPTTSFYDWIYISALRDDAELCSEIIDGGFDAFTDIEFNPNRSVNCQARTVATFVLLYRTRRLDEALKDYASFCRAVYLSSGLDFFFSTQ